MNETEAYLILNQIPKIGPIRTKRLIAVFGTPQGILKAKAAELVRIPGIGPEIAQALVQWEAHIDLGLELQRITDFGAQVLTTASPNYPRLLREIPDAPLILYVWGCLCERDHCGLGVVGTRQPSAYALECAKKFSYTWAYSGLTLFSGLARGIDTAVHQAALAAKGRTVAVLGSGLLNIYPPENQELAKRIIQSQGAVISEFPMNTTADRQTFPMRNRIISGSTQGLVVIEAGLKSGALISAHQALEQGRTLYAIPGRILQPQALGSNRLLQQGAHLVLQAEDILQDFQELLQEKLLQKPLEKATNTPSVPPTTNSHPQAPELPFPTLETLAPPAQQHSQQIPLSSLSENERSIYRLLDTATQALDLDQLTQQSGLSPAQISATLLKLEMRQLITAMPGARFRVQ